MDKQDIKLQWYCKNELLHSESYFFILSYVCVHLVLIWLKPGDWVNNILVQWKIHI